MADTSHTQLRDKFAAVRELTLLGCELPTGVFDTARTLFVKRFNQRIPRAFAMGRVEVNENMGDPV